MRNDNNDLGLFTRVVCAIGPMWSIIFGLVLFLLAMQFFHHISFKLAGLLP